MADKGAGGGCSLLVSPHGSRIMYGVTSRPDSLAARSPSRHVKGKLFTGQTQSSRRRVSRSPDRRVVDSQMVADLPLARVVLRLTRLAGLLYRPHLGRLTHESTPVIM